MKEAEEKKIVEQAASAIEALLAHVAREQAKKETEKVDKKMLWEEDEEGQRMFFVQISLKRIADISRRKPYRISLPHAPRDYSSVCVITKDPQKEWKEKIEEEGIEGITRVISVGKLRKKFGQYKQRRELLAEHDLFLADDRVLPMLGRALGSTFLKRQPIPVDMTKPSIAKEIQKAKMCTMLHLNEGPCSAIRVGSAALPVDALVENVRAVLHGLVKHIPRGFENVQALHLKTQRSIALPFYADLEELEIEDTHSKRKSEKEAVSGKRVKKS